MTSKRALLLLTVLSLCGGAAGAQVYSWTDDKGVTHYSDQPPPPSTPARTKVDIKVFASGAPGAELPRALADAVRDRPVTLYSTGQCEGCDRARAMLLARGIPFSEKTVNTAEDQAVLKQAGSNGQLPLLLVGRGKLIGFEQGAWDALLSDAGYPTQKMLPPNYPAPAARPAAPAPGPGEQERARAAAEAAAEEEARRSKAPNVNAPPNFQF